MLELRRPRAWLPRRRNFRNPLGAIVFLGIAAFVTSPIVVAAGPGYAPRFSHVMVIVLENQSLDDVLVKNPAAHYILDELTPRSALATRFYAPKRNSPTTYFALSSGLTYTEGDGGGHWAGRCGPSLQCSSTDETIYGQLSSVGRSWRIYSEDQALPCQLTPTKKYWVGHNPAVFYQRLGPNGYVDTGDGSCQRNDVSMEALPADLAGGMLPDYSVVIPNDCDNMHDACAPLRDRVLQGDAWLRNVMSGDRIVSGGLMAWAEAHDTLLVVTFDEARLDTDREGCCPYRPTGGGGHIPTWLLGPPDKVRAGERTDAMLSSFSILKTVEDNWNLPLLGHAAAPETKDLGSMLVAVASKPSVPPPAIPAAGGSSVPAGPSASASPGGSPAASAASAIPAASAASGIPAAGGLVPKESDRPAAEAPVAPVTLDITRVIGLLVIAGGVLALAIWLAVRRSRRT